MAHDKSKTKYSDEMNLKILREILDIKGIKDITSEQHVSRNTYTKIDKRIRARMGLSKPNKNLSMEWARRIYTVLDNNEVGLSRAHNSEYIKYEETLRNQSLHISETRLYQIIWDYVDNCYAAFSLEVFVKKGNIKSIMHYFPFEARNMLDQMDDKLFRASNGSLIQINHVLEQYKMGESFEEK